MFYYFESLSRNKTFKPEDKDYRRIIRKMDYYFKAMDLLVENEEILKDFMYSTKVHREILSIKL
jgi:hypothetical protein